VDERDRIASLPKPRVTVDFPIGLKGSNQFGRFADVSSSIYLNERIPLKRFHFRAIDSPVP
jgi:hypothetical protein